MRRLGRVLLGAGLLGVQLVALLLFTGLGSLAVSYLVAHRYPEDGTPPRHFPTVAAESAGHYRLLRWDALDEADFAARSPRYALPEPSGRFELEPIGSVVPVVSFEVLESRDGRQRIAVTWSDDDYVTHVRYSTDGTTVEPEYYRIWGGATVLVGLPAGILGAWLVGLGARRALRRASARD